MQRLPRWGSRAGRQTGTGPGRPRLSADDLDSSQSWEPPHEGVCAHGQLFSTGPGVLTRQTGAGGRLGGLRQGLLKFGARRTRHPLMLWAMVEAEGRGEDTALSWSRRTQISSLQRVRCTGTSYH